MGPSIAGMFALWVGIQTKSPHFKLEQLGTVLGTLFHLSRRDSYVQNQFISYETLKKNSVLYGYTFSQQ